MKLVLEKLPYAKDDLSPVMSEDTIKYHRDNLAAGYVKRYNEGKGDAKFNEAGAFLHNIFFPQLKPPQGRNNPSGKCLEIINEKYESFDNFKDEFQKAAMSIQGSGWVYMDTSGNIKTIPNHKVRSNIALLVDWWEHAWALDYKQDKKKYLENIWKIINWDVVNDRLNTKVANTTLNSLVKIANKLDQNFLYTDADKVDILINKISSKGSILKGVGHKYINDIDINTLKYIRNNYEFTDDAKIIFDKKLNEILAAKNRLNGKYNV